MEKYCVMSREIEEEEEEEEEERMKGTVGVTVLLGKVVREASLKLFHQELDP